MSFTNQAETDSLELLFNNTAWPNIGDASGLQPSGAAGVFYISLHTADPGEGGNQTTNEANYGAYARQSVVRTTSGFTVSGNAVSNAAAITFPACTSGSNTITYFGIGSDLSGAGNLFAIGQITTPAAGLVVSTGITPSFAIGALTATME